MQIFEELMDIQFQDLKYDLSPINHSYGEGVFLLKNPYTLSLLAKLSQEETKQPLINYLVTKLYTHLVETVVAHHFPRKKESIPTRMVNEHPEAIYAGEVIDSERPVVIVDLMRAGILPSQVCYETLNYLMNPTKVRQDHFFLNRKVNEKNEVIGVNLAGAKIGGGVDQAIMLFPDPMGATGSSLSAVIEHYAKNVSGKPRSVIAMHLIITPEYIRHMKMNHPEVLIYALRLDRGLSSSQVLATIPGRQIEKEQGLNQHQYIIPGAGGLGEILNNSFV